MKKFDILNFIKKNFRTILEVIGALGIFGIIIAFMQLSLQQKQFSGQQQQFATEQVQNQQQFATEQARNQQQFATEQARNQQQFATEQAQRPGLKYYYQVEPSGPDINEIDTLTSELEEEFYNKVYLQKQDHPEKNYHEIVYEVLPLIRSIKSNQYIIQIDAENSGNATATTVRMKIEITYPISSINIEANEPSQIIEGGDGKNFVTIEINRLIPNDFAKVMITLENDSLTADKIIMYHILDNDNPPEIQSLSVTHNNQQALNGITAEGLVNKGSGYGITTQLKSLRIRDFTVFPDLQYVYSQQPTIRLFVSSNEGDAEQSYLPLATAVP